jgi:hypothetical protein
MQFRNEWNGRMEDRKKQDFWVALFRLAEQQKALLKEIRG